MAKRRKRYESPPDDEHFEPVSSTYGVMPPFKLFREHWDEIVGDEDYGYSLRGSDARTAGEVDIPIEGYFDPRELYTILETLVEAFEDGNEDAGDLASGILSTLGFEWV